MATIYYTVMGEGRGHAVRARAMVERLRGQHRLVLFSSFDGLEFLRGEYADDPEIEVRETEGIKFHYSQGKLDLAKTIKSGLGTWWNLSKTIDRLSVDFERDRPDLVVTDFEPTVARAAHRCGVPVLSLDHQHFLIAYDLAALPRELQRWARLMGISVWLFGIGQQKTVVSAFYRPPLRRGWEHAVQVGPLLRPAVRRRAPSRGEHVLSYFRRATTQRELDCLEAIPAPVRVYGLGPRPGHGNVEYREIDEQTFLDDLSTCDAVISAAGNQLLGEALYFGKPVLALPERKHHEQRINACFLAELGGGEWRFLEEVDRQAMLDFWTRRDEHRRRLAESGLSFDGTDASAEAIEAMLPTAAKQEVVS